MDLKALPAELAHFVQQALARGTYQSEEELMAEAVRVLKARVSRQEAGQQPNGSPMDTSPQTPDEYVHAIAQALDTGDPVQARTLALAGAERYPQHAALRTYAQVLAPPTATVVPATPPRGPLSRPITLGSQRTGRPIGAAGLRCGLGSYSMPRPPWRTSSRTSGMSAGGAFY